MMLSSNRKPLRDPFPRMSTPSLKAVASARKSLGEYKPLILIKDGTKTIRSQVVEKSVERFDRHTKNGIIPGNQYARGNTYSSREEAILAAQSEIDFLFDQVSRQQQEIIARTGKPHPYVQSQIELYSR